MKHKVCEVSFPNDYVLGNITLGFIETETPNLCKEDLIKEAIKAGFGLQDGDILNIKPQRGFGNYAVTLLNEDGDEEVRFFTIEIKEN